MTEAFLKWAGGKSWLVSRYQHLIPHPLPGCTYREPFLGGGSVFFGAQANGRPAVLSDINKRLIDTPTGKAPTICDAGRLRACSMALCGVTLQTASYAYQLDCSVVGDAIFLDPPYVPVSETSNFVGYSASGFGSKDQVALAASLCALDARGVRWILTNSDTIETRKLYDSWRIISVSAQRSINCNTSKRGGVGEIVVVGKNCQEIGTNAN